MAPGSVPIDLEGQIGVVISSLAAFEEGSMCTVLDVDDLVRVAAAGTSTLTRVSVTNSSAETMRWAEPGAGDGHVQPGAAFELAIHGPSKAGRVQLLTGSSGCATLTISVHEGASGPRLLAQLLVGG